MGGIAFQDVVFRYAGSTRPVLNGLGAHFDASRITLLTGVSGSGKSTLLYLAAGLYPENAGALDGGTVRVNGSDPAKLPPAERSALVGMMFQNPPLQFAMDTVENEMAFCLENRRVPRERIGPAIDEALAFCGIAHLRGRGLPSLSGGEQQMAMLACLAALSPQWILLDEPFANLDDRSAGRIARKLLTLHKTRGTGILAVDHRVSNWAGIADEVRVMDASGNLAEDALRPQASDAERLVKLGVDVPWVPYRSETPPKNPGAEPVLELRDLTVRYGDRAVLGGLNAVFHAGRMHAVTGESGSGKTTLFQVLRGILRYEGEILFAGKPLRRGVLRQGRIGFVVQNPQDQFVADTVLDEVMLGLRRGDKREEAERVLREIGLWRYRNLSPYMLSQGQQRRLGVAALLSYDCALLVCDEPTYAQDRGHVLDIMGALERAARARGVAVIFSTHDQKLAREYADVHLEMKEGKLRAIAESGL